MGESQGIRQVREPCDTQGKRKCRIKIFHLLNRRCHGFRVRRDC